jgi:DNA-binding NarL/FixJ family response regulator
MANLFETQVNRGLPLPAASKSRNLGSVQKGSSPRRPTVCLLAFHPLVLSEFERFLSGHPISVHLRKLEPDVIADPGKLVFPKASVYVVESHAHNPTTEALVLSALGSHPGARVMVVAEKFDQSTAFPLLRLGAKGLLSFSEASEQLARAIQEVARGGFWVPRALLSRFVDETLTAVRRPRGTTGGARLSRREKEVLEALLENLSNKEIASRLNMSERTAKFHVSNLLAKYGVRRRADLILLTLTQLDRPASA